MDFNIRSFAIIFITSSITMPQYLVRLAQVHESFRKAELEALAELAGIEIKFDYYFEDVGKVFRHTSSFRLSSNRTSKYVVLNFHGLYLIFVSCSPLPAFDP